MRVVLDSVVLTFVIKEVPDSDDLLKRVQDHIDMVYSAELNRTGVALLPTRVISVDRDPLNLENVCVKVLGSPKLVAMGRTMKTIQKSLADF